MSPWEACFYAGSPMTDLSQTDCQSPASPHSLPCSPINNGYPFIDRPSTFIYESIGSIGSIGSMYNVLPTEQPTSSINWRKISHVRFHDRVWALWHNMRIRWGR
jgi:hypothetical protein